MLVCVFRGTGSREDHWDAICHIMEHCFTGPWQELSESSPKRYKIDIRSALLGSKGLEMRYIKGIKNYMEFYGPILSRSNFVKLAIRALHRE
jgi:hypothetical protein